MSIQENKRLAERLLEILSAGDVAAMLDAYTHDFRYWTAGSTPISGSFTREQVEANAGAIFQAFPEGLRFSVQAMTAEGDRVAVEAESHGVHASGAVYHNQYHFLLIFRDGKIAQLKEYLDTELANRVLCGGG